MASRKLTAECQHVGNYFFLANVAVATLVMLPVAFLGKAPATEGSLDIAGRTTVLDLLGSEPEQALTYVYIAATFARLTILRYTLLIGAAVVFSLWLNPAWRSTTLMIIHQIVAVLLLLLLWVQAVAILMCVC